MKPSILKVALLLFTGVVFAQDKAEIKDFFWGNNDTYKDAYSIPEKWKNESAVILYKYENHDYHNYRVNVTYTASIRKRVKLLDAAAVNEFSEFSFLDKIYSNKGFTNKAGSNTFGVKVIKSDGKVIEIDVEKETKLVDNQNKIAIANLEVGDIIDFYLQSVEKFKTWGESGFTPIERTLGDEYPIMDYKLNFQSENDFFINFNTYNGAPQLAEVKAERSSDRKYELKANNIEKNNFPRWFYPLVELPCYKFQVFFAKNGYDRNQATAFLSEKEKIIKKTVSKEDVLKYYHNLYLPDFIYNPMEKPAKGFLKNKQFSSTEEKIIAMYNYYRYYYFTKRLEEEVTRETKILDGFELKDFGLYFYSESQFMKYFTTFLKDNKIDYDIIIATERVNGSIEDLLIQDNANTFIRVNTPTPLYIDYFTPFSGIETVNPKFENTKAYSLHANKGFFLDDIKLITLPSSTVKDNISKTISKINFSSDLKNLNITRDVTLKGHFKIEEQKDKLYFFDYISEDIKKFEGPELQQRIRKEKEAPKLKNAIDALIMKYKDVQKENFKKNVSSEFGTTVEDYSSEVVNSGRYKNEDPFSYKESFLIKDSFIKKAGENYLFEIGKMLTSQVAIDKKEHERKNNIYNSFPKSIENEFIFEIPNGYTVSGIEKLNKSVTNETGQFVSLTSLEGNKLIIKTTKNYNNYFEPSSNWSKMILFLDEAYQFSQEKILLKKI